MALVHDLQFIRANSKTYTLEFTLNNVAQDVTGWTVFFTVKTNYTDVDADAKIKVDVVAPNNSNSQAGKILVPLTIVQTDITPGTYYYDFKLKKSTGNAETIITGNFIINPNITIRNS